MIQSTISRSSGSSPDHCARAPARKSLAARRAPSSSPISDAGEAGIGPGKLTPYRDQAIRAEVRRELDIAKARYGGRDFEVLCLEGGWSDPRSDRQPLR
jgi:hypothetical protein